MLDVRRATHPAYETPFCGPDDAIQRLVVFHSVLPEVPDPLSLPPHRRLGAQKTKTPSAHLEQGRSFACPRCASKPVPHLCALQN